MGPNQQNNNQNGAPAASGADPLSDAPVGNSQPVVESPPPVAQRRHSHK